MPMSPRMVTSSLSVHIRNQLKASRRILQLFVEIKILNSKGKQCRGLLD